MSVHGGACAICAPVWHELQFGVQRLPRGKRRTALQTFLNDVVRPTLPILPYDERAAAWHGAERARLERAGKKPPFVSGQVAAIAARPKLDEPTLKNQSLRYCALFLAFSSASLSRCSMRFFTAPYCSSSCFHSATRFLRSAAVAG